MFCFYKIPLVIYTAIHTSFHFYIPVFILILVYVLVIFLQFKLIYFSLLVLNFIFFILNFSLWLRRQTWLIGERHLPFWGGGGKESRMSAAGNQVGFWNKTYFGPSTADSPPDAENVVSGQHKLYHRSGPKISERLNLNGFNERNKKRQ